MSRFIGVLLAAARLRAVPVMTPSLSPPQNAWDLPMPSLLAFPDLKAKGIPFTRQHLHRLIKGGRFPAPLKLGEGTNRWLEHEVDQWLVDRAMERRSAPTAET